MSDHFSSHYNLRALAATAILDVLDNGKSLSVSFTANSNKVKDNDRGLMQEICFGVMRVLPELEFYLQTLMSKPFTGKNRGIHYLLMVGIYQILYTRIPEHAAVGETVNGAVSLKKPQLKGVVNGVLRSFLRQQETLKNDFLAKGNVSYHPAWLLERIKRAYPKNWQAIIDANNQKPPMWLRVNVQQYSTKQYQTMLLTQNIESILADEVQNALRLVEPLPVQKLPEFDKGAVTVQDLSAQHAAFLLAPKDGEQILDMCAAPGGKTTHILELAPKANVTAVDIDKGRVKRIDENLSRLKLQANVIVGDGLTPEKWISKEQLFDRILLDAPCSATGVIRRHPDIKWLRRDNDIQELVNLQAQILAKIWRYLKPGGTLVYATCSILPDENKLQIEKFIGSHQDAILDQDVTQYLPAPHLGDGFFYAKLQKKQ